MRIKTARQARRLRSTVQIIAGSHREYLPMARMTQAIAIAHGATLDEALRVWKIISHMPVIIIDDPERMSAVIKNELQRIRNGDQA